MEVLEKATHLKVINDVLFEKFGYCADNLYVAEYQSVPTLFGYSDEHEESYLISTNKEIVDNVLKLKMLYNAIIHDEIDKNKSR